MFSDSGFYTPGETACSDCALGRFSGIAGSKYCADCLAGTYSQPRIGSSACVVCEAGRWSGATQGGCTSCPASTYLNGTISVASGQRERESHSSRSKCLECPLGTFSSVGASSCGACEEGYRCPEGFGKIPCEDLGS